MDGGILWILHTILRWMRRSWWTKMLKHASEDIGPVQNPYSIGTCWDVGMLRKKFGDVALERHGSGDMDLAESPSNKNRVQNESDMNWRHRFRRGSWDMLRHGSWDMVSGGPMGICPKQRRIHVIPTWGTLTGKHKAEQATKKLDAQLRYPYQKNEGCDTNSFQHTTNIEMRTLP